MITKGERTVSKIIQNLWIGNDKSAINKSFLDDNNIDIIINCTSIIDNKVSNRKIKNYNFPFKDTIEGCIKLHSNIDKIINIISSAIKKNKNVLIHCKRGHRRSVAIAIIYLIKSGKSYDNAIKLMKTRRKYSLPNRGVLRHYLKLYKI